MGYFDRKCHKGYLKFGGSKKQSTLSFLSRFTLKFSAESRFDFPKFCYAYGDFSSQNLPQTCLKYFAISRFVACEKRA